MVRSGDGFVVGSVNDVVYYANFAFFGRMAPPPPFPDCGVGGLASDAVLGCGTAWNGCE